MTQELAATQSEGKVGEWQPIGTAPRDGGIVWVGSPDSICVAYWAGRNEPCWRNWFKGCRYGNVGLGADAFLPERVWFEPTHWQPLPSTPPLDPPLKTE